MSTAILDQLTDSGMEMHVAHTNLKDVALLHATEALITDHRNLKCNLQIDDNWIS